MGLLGVRIRFDWCNGVVLGFIRHGIGGVGMLRLC